jgi:mono/diheme cytochrome c family protein
MAMHKLVQFVMVLGMSAWAQSPTYGVGRAPTAEEIRAWDISIGPAGKELPPGHGTSKEGEQFFKTKGCAGCHGINGNGGRAPILIASKDTSTKIGPPPGKMVGMEMGIMPPGLMATSAPYAQVIWDYINRGMPINREGTLSANEVYSLTAFLLAKNGVIKEDEVMDAQTLPKVKMQNHDGFAVPAEWKHGGPRLANYP